MSDEEKELEELTVKVNRLDVYLKSYNIKEAPVSREKRDLIAQLHFMNGYKSVLERRVKRVKAKMNGDAR